MGGGRGRGRGRGGQPSAWGWGGRRDRCPSLPLTPHTPHPPRVDDNGKKVRFMVKTGETVPDVPYARRATASKEEGK